MSYWQHRRPVHRTRAVDVHGIALTAVTLLDEGGVRALTVRAVAERLGVAAASLYSRIESVGDVFDLALDAALGNDAAMRSALAEAGVNDLMITYYRHLTRHRWACQVIGMRAPRGPNYLRLSERLLVLLDQTDVRDPLATAYTLSNFVIGSATTAGVTENERTSPVDAYRAPVYARLHRDHAVDPEQIVRAGLAALCPQADH